MGLLNFLYLKQSTVAYENNDKRMESVYSKRIRAGKRRTYFFDVRATRSNDYYLTITESRKKFNEDGYDRHKIFLYKEDFNKFIKALTEAVDYVKTDLMPDFDFDAFNHDQVAENGEAHHDHPENNHEAPLDPIVQVAEPEPVKKEMVAVAAEAAPEPTSSSTDHLEEVDKW
jgi:hypothetical protein